jgi:hypothetical protein
MMVRRSFLWVAAVAVTAFVAAPALAAPRDYWRHSRGHFKNTSGAKWVEKIGDNTYRYVEQDRVKDYVELYDDGRDVTVRLFENRCMVKVGRKPWEKYYNGSWE